MFIGNSLLSFSWLFSFCSFIFYRVALAEMRKNMYPWNISGITGKIPGKFVFTQEANEQTMRQLVDELPPQITVGFYDKDYPSPSDPGAFVLFKRDLDQYIMQRANHGWSTKWETITVESLVGYLSQCSKYNMGLDGYEGMYFESPPPKQKKWWEFWK